MRLLTMLITFICAVVACFMVNGFAPNGQTAFQIVSRFPVPISPSPVILYFWIAVYGAIAVSFFAYRKNGAPIPLLHTALFNLSMLTHALTFFSWQQQLFTLSVVFAFFTPLLSFYMYVAFYKHATPNQWTKRIPISLFISFCSCLFLWEAAFVITYVEWHGFGLSEQLWGVLLLTCALVLGMYIRYLYDDPYFLIAYAWLFICIIIEHHVHNLFVSAAALFLCIVTLLAMKYAKKA